MARAGTRVLDDVAGVRAGRPAVPEAHATIPPAVSHDIERLVGNQPLRWLALAGSWLAVAFSVGFGLYVNYRAQGRDTTFMSALMAMIPHYVIWLLVSPALYRSLHRTIEGVNRARWALLLVSWSVIAMAGSTAMSYLSYSIRHDLPLGVDQLVGIYVAPPAGPAFHAMNLSILALALVAFAAVRGLRLRDRALWGAAQVELRRARLEAQLADARLQALQAQINPHFLLNSLNAVAGLVQAGERDRAFDAIGRLGELLQVALRNGRDASLTLGDEIDFLQRYLKLCELRFDSRFCYCISVPEALRSQNVPALIVQPLIENAIRHGMQSARALHVDIRAYESGNDIMIEVEDDGCGISVEAAADPPAGHGLANVAERLRLFFGETCKLRLEPRAPRGTRAVIVIAAAPSPTAGA